ncbi:SOS response-associated peptidase [Kyrpidia sp.]|uniref:SOS response-associated peptidase n=1 Tax=Kyrpidia sp. TaxID=2073077 RepID=UPI0033906EE7
MTRPPPVNGCRMQPSPKPAIMGRSEVTLMCGRYTLTVDFQVVFERFGFQTAGDFTYTPRYNIAPSQPVLAIISDGRVRRGGYLRWGLVPPWAKDPSIGNRMINARIETAATKPAFREAIRHRRCLIPADGFYEWKSTAGGKIPMRCTLRSREVFAFAGLWETWKGTEGKILHTCTILTTAAAPSLASIHDRMPVIVPRELEQPWLDPGLKDPEALFRQLRRPPGEDFEAYEVSRLVNSAGVDDPRCIEPAAGKGRNGAPSSAGTPHGEESPPEGTPMPEGGTGR